MIKILKRQSETLCDGMQNEKLFHSAQSFNLLFAPAGAEVYDITSSSSFNHSQENVRYSDPIRKINIDFSDPVAPPLAPPSRAILQISNKLTL